jgi:diguanylate cyclase (GGDEF)-like protein/PAS domain S-box-containing protein
MHGSLLRNALFALLASGILGATFGAWQGRESWTAGIEELQRETLMAADKVELLVRNMRLGAEAVTSRLDPDDLVGSAEEAWPAIEAENLGLVNVLVLDETGTAVAGMRKDSAGLGMNFSDRSYFQSLQSDEDRTYYLGAPIVTRPAGTWALPMSAPVLTQDGTFAGVVVGAVGEDYLDRIDWQAIGSDLSVHVHLHEGNAVFDVTNPVAPARHVEAIRARLPDLAVEAQDAGLVSVALPGMVAYASESLTSQFHVIVSRGRVDLLSAALSRGIFMGLAVTVLLFSLLYISLQVRHAAREREADARRMMENAAVRQRDAERLRLLEERLRLATDAAHIGVWDLDLESGHNTWDANMHALYGTTSENFTWDYNAWRDRVHPDDIKTHEAKFQAAVANGQPYHDVFRVVTPAGVERVLSAHSKVITDETGAPVRAIGVNIDVTERVRHEQDLSAANARILHDALHDPLTNLGNRRGLSEHLRMIMEDGPEDAQVSLIQFDLDRFKAVNDLFGHAAGDHLLVEVAGILRRMSRPGDALFRLGGDEFAIVLTSGKVASVAQDIANRILAACREPIIYDGKVLRFGASAGICTCQIAEIEHLVGNADIALYEAKKCGRNRVELFTPSLRRGAEEKKRIADELTEAIAYGNITLRFQPQVWTNSGKLAGAEALARWQHKERGELPPSAFLPIAEELGILHEIDDIILTKTVAAVRRMAARGLNLPCVSVNTSERRLMQWDLLEKIQALGPLPCRLAFELLESIDFDGASDDLMARLAQIRSLGVEIEVDDFGSGHASVTSLLRVQPDRVKIDRQLVTADILAGRKAQSVLRAITDMAEALDISVTAEGVETEAHAERVAALGCDKMQGYLFSKPLTEADFLNWARRNTEHHLTRHSRTLPAFMQALDK